jgi:hypothetical protein
VDLKLRDAVVVSLPADPTSQPTVIKIREEDARTIKRLHTQITADCGTHVRKPLQVDETHGFVLSAITIVKPPQDSEEPLALVKGEVYDVLQVQVVGVLRGEDDKKSSLLLAVRAATPREVPVEEIVVDDGRREEADAHRARLQQVLHTLAYEISELHEKIRTLEVRAAEVQGVVDALDPESRTWFEQAHAVLSALS